MERCPLERVRGRPTQSTVDEANHRCRFVGFNTLCAERARAPRNARVFFEVVIERCVGVVQLGWIGTVVRCDQESGDGVGDDQVSWGVDGIRLKKWAGGDTPYRTARKWRDGDVIGCAADLARGDLSFALNGVWSGPDGVAFRGVAMPENGLAPAVTGGYGFACVVNLGDRPWRHGPPAGFRAAHEFFRASTGLDEWLAVHLGGDGNAEARAAVRAAAGGDLRRLQEMRMRDLSQALPLSRWDPAARDAFLEAARELRRRPPVT